VRKQGQILFSAQRSPGPEPRRLLRGKLRSVPVFAARRRDALISGRPRSPGRDPGAALEYAERLAKIAAETRGELVIVMRTYVDKPRSTRGWKGLVNDPHLDGSCDVALGLRCARETLLAIAERDVPCGSEILDPATLPYLEDLLAWGSIGARTTESQVHRVAASGRIPPASRRSRARSRARPRPEHRRLRRD